MIRIGWFLVLGGVLTHCAGPVQSITREPSNPNRPTWIRKMPKERGQAFVVGVSTRAKSLEEGRDLANRNAAVQVSNIVGMHVQSKAQSHMSTDGTNSASEEIKARTAALVQSLVVMDEYSERVTKMVGSYYEESFDVWLLGKFPLAAADKERRRQAKAKKQKVLNALDRYLVASKNIQKGQLLEGRVSLADIKATLDGVYGSVDINRDHFETSVDLQRKVKGDLRRLNDRAKSVTFVLVQGGEAKTQLTAALAAQAATMGLAVQPNARFAIHITYETRIKPGRVMGQRVMYVTYSAKLRDQWRDAVLSGDGGEVNGFGKTPSGALADGLKEAAQSLVKTMGTVIAQKLSEEISP